MSFGARLNRRRVLLRARVAVGLRHGRRGSRFVGGVHRLYGFVLIRLRFGCFVVLWNLLVGLVFFLRGCRGSGCWMVMVKRHGCWPPGIGFLLSIKFLAMAQYGVGARRLTAYAVTEDKLLRASKTLQPQNDTRRLRPVSMNRIPQRIDKAWLQASVERAR